MGQGEASSVTQSEVDGIGVWTSGAGAVEVGVCSHAGMRLYKSVRKNKLACLYPYLNFWVLLTLLFQGGNGSTEDSEGLTGTRLVV